MKLSKKIMKKKKDWQTKAKKRKYKEKDRGILGVVFIVKHFWNYLKMLSPECLADLRKKMIKVCYV